MLVKCPGCYTTYRVAENLIASSKPTFRCSRCKLIFALDLKSKVTDEPETATIQTTLGKRDNEPNLPFPSSTEATAKESEDKEFFAQEKTESAPPDASNPQPSEPQAPTGEDAFNQRQDPFAPGKDFSFENQEPLGSSDDSIAEIQRFLAESQEPPKQDPEALNRSMDFPIQTQDSSQQDQQPEEQTSEATEQDDEAAKKEERPLSPHEFFAQRQDVLSQEAGAPDESLESERPVEEFLTQTEEPQPESEETTPPKTSVADPFGFEREAPSRGGEVAAVGESLDNSLGIKIPKPKIREYKGKTFGVKKKSPASGPAAEDADQSPQPYVERRRTPIPANESPKGGPVSVIPYISLFGILLLAFSLLTLIYQAQPAKLEAYLKSIPWFGPAIFKNNHLRQGVVLESLQSGFQKILGGGQVFVITGKISNRNPVSVREIRLEGAIHAQDGKEIGRQTISVGNPISSKIIRDMTVREIAILQRLKPQKRFEIAPEGSASFTIVFPKPPKEIEGFSCRVLSTKGEA